MVSYKGMRVFQLGSDGFMVALDFLPARDVAVEALKVEEAQCRTCKLAEVERWP